MLFPAFVCIYACMYVSVCESVSRIARQTQKERYRWNKEREKKETCTSARERDACLNEKSATLAHLCLASHSACFICVFACSLSVCACVCVCVCVCVRAIQGRVRHAKDNASCWQRGDNPPTYIYTSYVYIRISVSTYIHTYILHTYIHACMHAYIHTYIVHT